jgi:frataxin-like iron-binding protein CyaY
MSRIEELVAILTGHIDDSKMSVGTNRLHITVTESVDIIIEMEGPMYEVWIQNHAEGEGCTVARTDAEFYVASFCLSVFKVNNLYKE